MDTMRAAGVTPRPRVRGDVSYFASDIARAAINNGCDFSLGVGAAMRHLPSGSRAVNTVWMWAALLATKLSAWLQELGELDHANGRGRAHLITLHHLLLAVPAGLVRHAGQATLRLPPGRKLLTAVLARLRQIPVHAWV